MGESVIKLTDENFEKEVLQAEQPVLVDFWASWCGPCRVMAPIIDELATEHKEKIKVGKLNVDENSETAQKYEIRSIPTLVIFEKDEVKKQLIGAMPKEKLATEISEWLE